MHWLGGWFVVLAALLCLGACSPGAPASDTVPENEDEETLLAVAAPTGRHIV